MDSGGPRETVVNDVTGYLCPSNETHFAAAMARLVKDPSKADRVGGAGKSRFMKHFSFDAFSLRWDHYIEGLMLSAKTRGHDGSEGNDPGGLAREHAD